MEPTLNAGDVVFVDPRAIPVDGDVVCAQHPNAASTHLIKRVAFVEDDHLFLTSDNAHAEGATDSNRFGLIEPAGILGVVTGVLRGR